MFHPPSPELTQKFKDLEPVDAKMRADFEQGAVRKPQD